MTKEQYIQFAHNTFKEIHELIQKKNADYTGNSNDPFANFRMVEYLSHGKVSMEQGLFTRLSDKFARLGSLMGGAKAQNESLEDSLKDIIGYSMLYLAVKQDEKTPPTYTTVINNIQPHKFEYKQVYPVGNGNSNQ